MINKEDIKVGLRFYITRNDCLKCNFDPIGIQGGSTPILFNVERKDADVYICTSVSTDYRYIARFREKDIMMFGTKFDIVTKCEGKAANEKTDADRFKEIIDKMSDTYKRKNHDYGNAFSEMYDELGINYGYGKIQEKVKRIKTLKDNESQVANEPLEDTLIDCANYCILTLMEYQNVRNMEQTDYTCKDCFFFKNGACNQHNEIRFASEENPSCTDFEYKEIKVEL